MDRRTPFHPDVETLLGHWEGTLPPARDEALATHLCACDACRVKYHRLNTAWRAAREQTTPKNQPGRSGLAAVLAGIHAWEARRSSASGGPAAVKQGVAKWIGPYLGKRAAHCILEPVSDDGQDLLPAIEPVLALFLGHRAASQLVSHVIDAAIMRI